MWQKSFQLAKDVYIKTKLLPKSEDFGLTSQIRRAAVSIPSNIAEGQQRNSSKEFERFLNIARGSAAELATQLELSSKIYRLKCDELLDETEQIQKMLYVLISKL